MREIGRMGCKSGPNSAQINLPPGFRFYPTDEELMVHYLCKRVASQPFPIPIIAEIDLYKFDPWQLPEKALFGEKEWYFFSPRDRKYPNGSRPNRAAGSGYWKATGTDKPVTAGLNRMKVGVKKALVFYKGKAPRGVKTNWIMHEYRLADSASRAAKRKGSIRLDDWVLCRIYEKHYASQKAVPKESNELSSCVDPEEDQYMAPVASTSPPDMDDNKLLINLPRINSLNRINSLLKFPSREIMKMPDPNYNQTEQQYSRAETDAGSNSGGQAIEYGQNSPFWRNQQFGYNYDQMAQNPFPQQLEHMPSLGANSSAFFASLAAELL